MHAHAHTRIVVVVFSLRQKRPTCWQKRPASVALLPCASADIFTHADVRESGGCWCARAHTHTRAHTHSHAVCCNSADMRKLFMNVHTHAHKLIHYLRSTNADLSASGGYCARVYTLKYVWLRVCVFDCACVRVCVCASVCMFEDRVWKCRRAARILQNKVAC